jgi:glycosyltransferase involved in cell wall biosynthesis
VVGASIVLCTRNRADRLGECLAHLAGQVVAPGTRVGSTDGTNALVRGWCAPGAVRAVGGVNASRRVAP